MKFHHKVYFDFTRIVLITLAFPQAQFSFTKK